MGFGRACGPALPNLRLRSTCLIAAGASSCCVPEGLRKTGHCRQAVMLFSFRPSAPYRCRGILPRTRIARSLDAIGAEEKIVGAFVCHDPDARAQTRRPVCVA